MHPDLSFEQAPPVSVPYRFFLAAPWFGVAAGLLLAWLGEGAWASRWSPGTLALTHLLVVGYMLQAMAGALFQFVPVAVGGNVWRPRLVAAIVQPLLLVAAPVLAAAFLGSWSAGFLAAGPLFALAVGIFVVAVGSALWRTAAQGPTLRALRSAVAALAVTVALGVTLAESLGRGLDLPFVEMVDVHAAWGLGGWALLLLAGVSFHVVPMFQLTPPYPPRLAAALPPAMLAALLLWSWQLGSAKPAWQEAAYFLGLTVAAAFAAVTLRLQFRRRRKIPDPTLLFFRLAMASLLAAAASAVALALIPGLAAYPRSPVWIGVLVLAGTFVSAINGMLYRIVPFINWLDLQRLAGTRVGVPNVREMIPEKAVFGQLRLHFAAVALLLAAVLLPPLTRAAAALFAASCTWLGWNLIGAARRYREFRDRIAAGGPGRE